MKLKDFNFNNQETHIHFYVPVVLDINYLTCKLVKVKGAKKCF